MFCNETLIAVSAMQLNRENNDRNTALMKMCADIEEIIRCEEGEMEGLLCGSSLENGLEEGDRIGKYLYCNSLVKR